MLRMIAALGLAVTIAATAAWAAPLSADETTIASLLHGMFDKPGETLLVEPVVVAGDHAIADWTQGQMGGRALLRRAQQQWTLILCAGDGIKSADAMQMGGVPPADAKALETGLATAEAKLSPERLALFSRFEGLVGMDGKDGESQHHN
ncbi:MAG TPA: copper uptake system-associated protein [Bradyrhizobium sp.]|nr:copper uptake system-associated protein [Bradyrhizobium sp.]